jgi:hypothetical protein
MEGLEPVVYRLILLLASLILLLGVSHQTDFPSRPSDAEVVYKDYDTCTNGPITMTAYNTKVTQDVIWVEYADADGMIFVTQDNRGVNSKFLVKTPSGSKVYDSHESLVLDYPFPCSVINELKRGLES